jgi:hypothetical protein
MRVKVEVWDTHSQADLSFFPNQFSLSYEVIVVVHEGHRHSGILKELGVYEVFESYT